MNTNFKVIGLTRLGIKPGSAVLEADALTTRPSELLVFIMSSNDKLFQLQETIIKRFK